MSSSQFDDLLGDFGGESANLKASSGANGGGGGGGGGFDDFDPFAAPPSSTTPGTNGGGDSNLLLDFSLDAQSNSNTSGQSANPLYDAFEEDTAPPPTSTSANPLYDDNDFTSTTPNSGGGGGVNPLYDFEDNDSNQQQQQFPSDDPFGDFSSQPQHEEQPGSPTNPLYQEQEEAEVDQFTMADQQQEDQSDSSNPLYEDQGQIGDYQQGQPEEYSDQQQEEEEDMAGGEEPPEIHHLEEMPPQVMNGDPRAWFGSEHLEPEEDIAVVEPEGAESAPEDDSYNTEDRAAANVSSGSGRLPSDSGPESRAAYSEEPIRREDSKTDSAAMENLEDDDDDDEEEGVYENQPEIRSDVVREVDHDASKDLPASGTASSMRARFLQGVEEAVSPSASRGKREITPPAHGSGGEYVSEPRTKLDVYEAKPDAGVFESPEPAVRDPEIVSAYDTAEEAKPEEGTAKNLAARFKDLEKQNASSAPSPRSKREITPPAAASGPSEFVSEPRGPGVEQYEAKVDAGVFESEPLVNPDVVHSGEAAEEALPEVGTAKNLRARYLQMTEESKSPTGPTSPREAVVITAQEAGRVEFENEPEKNPDVITSDSQVEEFVPQRGFAKNLASRFKELESTAKSPPESPGRRVKEFTPPREQDRPAVVESAPAQQSPDVVHSGEAVEEALPEKGTARNMMQRFKQMESESKANSTPRAKKEFTPPPGDAGVYENTPKTFQADYNRPAESGVVENTPSQRDDVVKGDEPPRYEEELPERGAAKNLVSKWRQIETEQAAKVAKSPKSPGSRPKEFTPPRDEPLLANRKSPRTPLSPGGAGPNNNGSVHPSDLPGQYQPQDGASVYESTPDAPRDDVVREGERDYAADLPKKNTAKKMLARFQSFQEKASGGGKESGGSSPSGGASRQTSESSASEAEQQQHHHHHQQQQLQQPPRQHKASESSASEAEQDPAMENARLMFEDPAQIGRSKSMRAAVQLEKCGACEKTVYAMERLEMNKTVYHKACFRCSQCRSVLTPKTFAVNNGVIFCTNHYKQLFTTKGNYDEGFGRMQHKKRWSSNPSLADDANGTGQENGNHENGHHTQQQQQQQRQSSVTASNS